MTACYLQGPVRPGPAPSKPQARTGPARDKAGAGWADNLTLRPDSGWQV